MSHASMSQRLDAARKHAREEHQKGVDFHAAYPAFHPLVLDAIATLLAEAYSPSRPGGNDLGVRVTDNGDGWHIPRSNHAAAAELARWQRDQLRWATRIMGDESGRNVGRIEELVHGKASDHTSLAYRLGAA